MKSNICSGKGKSAFCPSFCSWIPWISKLFLTALAATIFATAVYANQHASRAKAILSESGVQGGLIVHIGDGAEKLTAALHANDKYVVQGLCTSSADVEKARSHIRSQGLCGPVSIAHFDGRHLPYADNLVNLVVVEELGEIDKSEVMRVLAPGGVAIMGNKKTVKARPDAMDEWTHYLYDATGNAVSRDELLSPPTRMQWTAGPRWSRHHEYISSMHAMVSSGGRIFYIIDEGPRASIHLPADWKLVARDAFNGKLLWKRDIAHWYTHIYPLKSGPAHLPRRLVAVGDRVYATLGIETPVSMLDAATGETIRTYADTGGAEEIVYSDGILFIKTVPVRNEADRFSWGNSNVRKIMRSISKERAWEPSGEGQQMIAVAATEGKTLWKNRTPVAPLSLSADGERVVCYNGSKLVCLDRMTGERNWASPVSWKSGYSGSTNKVFTFAGLSVVLYQDVVLVALDRHIAAFDAENGNELWSGQRGEGGHRSPMDLLVIDDLVWSLHQSKGIFTGLAAKTGEMKRKFSSDIKGYPWFHHRCHNARATTKYLLPSRTGIEFVDVENQHWDANHWVRGACLYGFMPANGMVYAPQDPCACYIEAKLKGLNALAGGEIRLPEVERRLVKGPAYKSKINGGEPTKDDWPTYRHDRSRSGATKEPVGADLKECWQSEISGNLTAPVVAGDRLFVAEKDSHTLHCLKAENGANEWVFAAGGRIDSPPTIHNGYAIFGCADGSVYCLRAADGKLAWKYLAARGNRQVVADNQVESVWPVSGSVLVQNGEVFCVAGRSSFLDNGMRFCRLDAETGELLAENNLDDKIPGTDKDLQLAAGGKGGQTMPTALPAILSSDGERIYMRSQEMDLDGNRLQIDSGFNSENQTGRQSHLFGTSGFLDDSWFHRIYWLYGYTVEGGASGWFRSAHYAPAGRIMVFNDETIFGFGRKPEYWLWSPALEYHLFAAAKEVTTEDIGRAKTGLKKLEDKNWRWMFHRELTKQMPDEELTAMCMKWSQGNPPLLARAMVLAADRLFVAGPRDTLNEEEAVARRFKKNVQESIDEQLATLTGENGARLHVYSAENGKLETEFHLDALPVWDGMIAAKGKLFISLRNGRVLCIETSK